MGQLDGCLRRKEEPPEVGEKVWLNRRGNQGRSPYGEIQYIDEDEGTCILLFEDGTATIELDELEGKWTDKFEGCYLIEDV